MHKEIFEKYHGMNEQEWLELLYRTPDEQVIDGCAFPGFPDAELQAGMVGSSGATALREVSALYKEVHHYMRQKNKAFDANTKVLDYGCGYGRIIRLFMKDAAPGNLFGTDVDEGFINICRDLFKNDLSFSVNSPLPPTGYPDSFFDVIYAYSVFTHLAEPVHLQWLSEIRRIAKPDALIFITLRQMNFIKQCQNLAKQQDLNWYDRALADNFGDPRIVMPLYEQGTYIYNPTGGGGVRSNDFYGDTVIPQSYIESKWKMLNIIDIFDDQLRLAQALAVLTPSPTDWHIKKTRQELLSPKFRRISNIPSPINEAEEPNEPQMLAEIIRNLQIGHEIDCYPKYLSESYWFENIPIAFWLMKVLRPKSFVELGTLNGVSYMAFCQAAASLKLDIRSFAVDSWGGDPHQGLYNGDQIFNDLSIYNNEHYEFFSTLLRQNFDEARIRFNEKEIDLLHIDGYHTFEAVKHDFETWKDCLSDRSVILFHDINVRKLDYGVWKFWEAISQKYPSFGFNFNAGLGILGYGKNIPEPLNALFSADKPTKLAIQRLFEAKGFAVSRYFFEQFELHNVFQTEKENWAHERQQLHERLQQTEAEKHQLLHPPQNTARTKLFGFLPILKTVTTGSITRRFLFNRIPILKTRRSSSKK